MKSVSHWIRALVCVTSVVFVLTGLPRAGDLSTGTVKGLVTDAETRGAIVGVSVLVVGTQIGAATDTAGHYTIPNLTPGNYTLRFQSIGYHTLSRTDVIVRPSRTTFVPAELDYSAVPMSDIVVQGGYFSKPEEKKTSTIGYSNEEIRRAPGSAGDVSRILMVLPSVAKVNDQVNSLIVRGGNPTENGFYIDNIEIPNINHFPVPGSSGGPIGLVNVDFIQDVMFSAGGFSSSYGNRLSSIMNLRFREGNRDEFDGQLDVNFAGFGAAAEGPIGHSRGSWMFSARRSYLDLIVDAIGIGIAPRYSDYQGKLVYDLSPAHTVSVIGLAGDDFVEFDKEQAIEDDNIVYGRYDGYEYAGGVNWRYVWSPKGYSETSVSTLGAQAGNNFFETGSDKELVDEVVFERNAQIRNINHYRFNDAHSLTFGVEGKYHFNDYDMFVADYTNSIGDSVPPLVIDEYTTAADAGLHAGHTWRIGSRLSTTLGLRYDYFSFTDHQHLSPRFSFVYTLNDRTSLTGATGVYYQSLPLGLLTQQDAHVELADPRAIHYVAGLHQLLSDNARLTLEGYYKDYDHFPVDPLEPQLFISDEIVYRFFFGNHETLLDVGEARSYGAEMTIRKKLVEGLYGLLSASLSRSEYLGLDDVWRERVFDNRLIFSAEGGYKPSRNWEFSARWIFAGGAPYTPMDIEASREINRSVLDRNRVNEERFPDYHSLNLRVDRRFHFGGSNLIAYISVWNAYNRENVSQYYWNDVEQRPDTLNQWSMIPLFGLEFEF